MLGLYPLAGAPLAGFGGASVQALAGDAVAVSTATGAMALSKPLAGSAASVATASGPLLLAVPLAGNATAIASATGVTTQSTPLSGNAQAVVTATGLLQSGIILPVPDYRAVRNYRGSRTIVSALRKQAA